MKKARLILSASMFALAGLTAISFSSCSKDEDCLEGWEGKNCDVEVRAPMLGTYNATDILTATDERIPYSPVISKNSTVSIINISKFSDFFTSSSEIVTSNVSKSGSNINFTIPRQKPDGLYEVSGSGTYNTNTNTIEISYTLESPLGDIDNYTGTWTKQ